MVVVAALIFFAPVVFAGESFSTIPGLQRLLFPWAAEPAEEVPVAIQSDQAGLGHPWQVEINRRVDEGTLPLWNRTTYLGGYPFFSNGNSSLLSPNRLGPALLGLSASAAHDVVSVAFLVMSGLAALAFLRALGLGRAASTLGAVSWMLCTFNLAWLSFDVTAPVQPMLPALAYLALRASRRRTLGSGVALGAAMAITMISGHILWMGITCTIAGGYLVALCLARWWRERRTEQPTALLRVLSVPAVAAAVAAGLSAVVLLPTALTLSTSQRSSFTYEDLYSFDPDLGAMGLTPPSSLVLLFVPPITPLDVENLNNELLFAGSLVAFAALVGVFVRRPGVGLGRFLAVGLGLVSIGGPATLVGYQVMPLLRVFRPYGRLWQWATFGVAILGAIGFQWLLDRYRRVLADRPAPPVALRPAVLAIGAIAITAAQLLFVGRELIPSFSDRDSHYPSTPLIEAVRSLEVAGGWPARVLPVSQSGIALSLGNQHLVHDIDTASGYDSTLPNRAYTAVRHLEGSLDAVSSQADAAYAPLFYANEVPWGSVERFGVTALVTPPADDVEGPWGGEPRQRLHQRVVYDGEDGNVILLPEGARPRLAWRTLLVADEAEAFETFTADDFDWRRTLVVEEGDVPDELRDRLADTDPIAGEVGTLAIGANGYRFSVEAKRDGWLVVPMNWDDGWSATVTNSSGESSSAAVVRVNYTQLAVPVSAGESTVSLRYRPVGLVAGAGVSGATAVASVALVGVETLARRRRRAEHGRAERPHRLDQELVGEEGGSELQPDPFDPPYEPQHGPVHVAFGEVGDRRPDRMLGHDPEAGLADEATETTTGEEAQVPVIEDAPLVVVEPSDGRAGAGVPVGDVRDAGEEDPVGPQHRGDLLEDRLGPGEVLEDVGREDDVEGALDPDREPVVEVGPDEGGHPPLDTGGPATVDADDLVPESGEEFGDVPGPAPEVEDP